MFQSISTNNFQIKYQAKTWSGPWRTQDCMNKPWRNSLIEVLESGIIRNRFESGSYAYFVPQNKNLKYLRILEDIYKTKMETQKKKKRKRKKGRKRRNRRKKEQEEEEMEEKEKEEDKKEKGDEKEKKKESNWKSKVGQ